MTVNARSAYLWCVHRGIRALMASYAWAMRIASSIGPAKRSFDGGGCDILLTGTFYSDNWIEAHVKPLAMSGQCSRVRMVASSPIPALEKVEGVYPPFWMVRIFGAVPARLLTFFREALLTRPHFVGGFHLLVNGLLAALAARLTGSRSIYFCVGGPREVLDGGIWGENRLFRRLETPDPHVEKRLISAVKSFDLVVTMGSGAITYFKEKGVEADFRVVSGGLDGNRLRPCDGPAATDLITVARIGSVKRVDIFLEAVKCIRERIPDVKATIVGDGPLRASMERMARDLSIEGNVHFAGHQKDVEDWLRAAKVFVLTSDSEGLSLALMEAMLCGLPAVVSHVGDLPELVHQGVNGYLVDGRTPEEFAERILEILTDETRRERFASAARRSAERYEIASTVRLWDDILRVENTRLSSEERT